MANPTYSYTNQPSASYHDAVRFMSGDLGKYPWSASDQEVAWILAGYGVTDPVNAGGQTPASSVQIVLAAACEVAEALAARLSSRGAVSIAGTSENLGQQKAQFEATAKRLRMRLRSSARPYFGGQSQAEKDASQANTAVPQPAFRRGMMTDNQTIA